jgi:hypothetical protein
VPAVGKDWNDRLLAEQGVQPKEVQIDRQAFKALWKWHRVAAEKGHPAAYLKRIAAVARDVVDGKGLSEKATQAMRQDLQGLEKSSQPVVAAVAAVPSKVATAVAQGTEAGM